MESRWISWQRPHRITIEDRTSATRYIDPPASESDGCCSGQPAQRRVLSGASCSSGESALSSKKAPSGRSGLSGEAASSWDSLLCRRTLHRLASMAEP